MMKFKSLLLLLPLLIIGCSDSGDAPTAPSGGGGGNSTPVSFASDIMPLITSNGCLGSACHAAGTSSGGLNLGSGSYADIRNASGSQGAIIVADSASLSNFYLKLTATPPFGSRMPLGRTPLSTTELDKIRDWINEGAIDN